MKHPGEEEIIAYRDGEPRGREAMARHLGECAECRALLERVESVLAALDAAPVPDPGEQYGQRVWQRIAPKLPQRRSWDWGAWLEPRRWAAAGALAAAILAAFLVGRYGPRKDLVPPAVNAAQVRERVLLVAVSDHLDRSEMILVELSHAEPPGGGKKRIDLSGEQRRAEEILEENRLYRQTARQQGDAALASVLDDLERVLLDVTHSPQEVTPEQFETIRQRIEAQGILFKVRVVGKDLRQRQKNASPRDKSGKKERNKA